MHNKIDTKYEHGMRQRIKQLRNQLDEISGGTALFSGISDEDVPLELELQFLEQVVSFEVAADTTWKQILIEEGTHMPEPDSLSDEEMSVEVWELIQALADMHCFLDFTDHLSDQELYKKLYERLDEPTQDIRMMDEGVACHLEILLSGDEADDLIWLKYFADEETRHIWQNELDIQLPPQEKPPYDRDRLLPQRTTPED